MDLPKIIREKGQQLARLSNQKGASGEINILNQMPSWLPRPKGVGLDIILKALAESGIHIKASSFDAIEIAGGQDIDFCNAEQVSALLKEMTFIEIKTSNQIRVKSDFTGFFFALTENEITASAALGARHKVALYNNITGVTLITSVPDIIKRAKSFNWQLSVQL